MLTGGGLRSTDQILPAERSTSRRRNTDSSPDRRPAKTSVPIRGRRSRVRDLGWRSSWAAAISRASIWVAESRKTGGGGCVGIRRRLPRAGLRSIRPRSSAIASTHWSTLIVLLIDVAESGRMILPFASRSGRFTAIALRRASA